MRFPKQWQLGNKLSLKQEKDLFHCGCYFDRWYGLKIRDGGEFSHESIFSLPRDYYDSFDINTGSLMLYAFDTGA